ncbi:InlB B-repeat-containing protein, partial [Methylobacterium crusticola]|uniref:InlB B-repeat-containing protein n=1 Tax=Methylobacterium crusticola TaxID=1697972 RepID=UPI001EE22394
DSRNDLIRPRIQVDAALDAVLPELSYSSGTRLTLTATPHPGFRLTLWRGCDQSAGNRCVVEMDSAKSVTAVFEPV